MNMAVRYIPILSLLIFCCPVRALYVSDVHSVHSCSNDKNVSVELLAAETSVFRIRICACFGLDGTNYVIAKSNDLCGFPISLLELDLNSSYGDSHQNCVLSKPIDFDPIFNSDEPLVLCSLNARKSWRTPIALALHPRHRIRRSTVENQSFKSSTMDFRPAVITGLRVEEAEKGVSYEDGASVVLAGTPVIVRLFGFDFSDTSEFRFVLGVRERGADCDNLPFTVTVTVDKDSLTMYSTLVHFRLPSSSQISDANLDAGESPAFYVCSLERINGYNRWIHQGKEPGVKLRTYQRTLPLWIQVVIITVLLSLSGLFSGLNLGLMALDRTELKLYENTGSEKEKRYSQAIIPVRDHGNYLLCTLLLGNVLVNSTLTILLDDLTSGIIAIVGSTVGIVIFGEIIPQAICSRFGLAIGAHTVWITKFFMLVTFPMSYPISLILDRLLGEEIGAYYNRERLKELIKVTNEYHDLEKEEVNIIAGALELRRKTVGDIMTRLEDVFMLSYDSVMDFETVSEIMKQGFSRIPVYEGERSNIVALLFFKELALVDPEDATPLKTLCQFYQNQCNFVFEDTTLDVIFKEFKEGHKGHMAFVQRVNCEGEGDPFYETVGLVTLEDVIEELIQAEIVDETDVWMDNRSKRRREKGKLLQDFSSFAIQYREQAAHKVSPQLALATFQYLSSCMEPFKPEYISENVLRRLMQQGLVIRFIRVKNKEESKLDPATLLYQQGKPADHFVLILEGRVEVTVGKENLVFETGPFSHFGSQALTSANVTTVGDSVSQLFRGSVLSVQSPSFGDEGLSGSVGNSRGQTFLVDYTVRAITDVLYFRVSRSLYQAAKSATLLERTQRDVAPRSNENEKSDGEFERSFLINKEDSELLIDVASEISRLGESVGSQRSLYTRTNYGTHDECSVNSSVRCSNQLTSVYRHSKPDTEKESLITNSSLPNSSSIHLIEGQYRRNEIFKNSIPWQTTSNQQNGNDSKDIFPHHLEQGGISPRCSEIYFEEWERQVQIESSATQTDDLLIRSIICETEEGRLAVTNSKSHSGGNS